MTRIVHAVWSEDRLHLWGESAASSPAEGGDAHPSALSVAELSALFEGVHAGLSKLGEASERTLRLPSLSGVPAPSPALAHALGHGASMIDDENEATPTLAAWSVPTLAFGAEHAPRVLERVEAAGLEASFAEADEGAGEWSPADDLRFYTVAARLARSLLARQQFVPLAGSQRTGEIEASWHPWLADEMSAERVRMLLRAMPASARAAADANEHDPWSVLRAFLTGVVDARARIALEDESMSDAIEGRDPSGDAQVRWLGGLLAGKRLVAEPSPRRSELPRTVSRWIGLLEERGQSAEWRLGLSLNDPMAGLSEDPAGDVLWELSFHLRAVSDENVVLDAEDIWSLAAESLTVEGVRIEQPNELLRGELGRAARVYPKLKDALNDSEPVALALNTKEAYTFLREVKSLLEEQGVLVSAPEWWDTPDARLGARLKLAPNEAMGERFGATGAPSSSSVSHLGLESLVSYEWSLAVGETPLSLEEFEKLAAERTPLVRIRGRWVEVRPEDLDAAIAFLRDNPGGEISVGAAMRLAFGADLRQTGLPILGVDAEGWIAGLLDPNAETATMPMLEEPKGFIGDLRPYQVKGLSWLSFLDRLGLGSCLADDMGLGKTIQLLAMLAHERELAKAQNAGGGPEIFIGPTLLVVPMSIVQNWKREAERFTPDLKVLVHHGLDRPQGDDIVKESLAHDLIVTTYALANRDKDQLALVPWHRVVLDEAQNIKNPMAKQSQAIRSLEAPRRIALTGTPLENRLSELWSIIDFCNPGLLGTLGEFRRAFSVPIERYHDKTKRERLRALVRPFILRRLKTDPKVITDLPPKVETKEYCRLSAEQAELYEATVRDMLGQVDRSEGIKRRGVVLATLTKLKQICNHPHLVGAEPAKGESVAAPRSGKCVRLLELLDEVVASGEKALVFTQFRKMGDVLGSVLRKSLDREVLFLHGGTPQGQRQKMIDRFQSEDQKAPVMILSLKAGGVGLNLTAASHVFHFDRWWNPAVENQATDRAFRIGQTRTVNVHKFIAGGTLEERIDAMIESKIALAEDVIGSGEDWLTEMSTTQLREVLSLRPDALGDEA
ncbi:MAG: DEAD/DEAH box helicase [Planctomycetota bacterium]